MRRRADRTRTSRGEVVHVAEALAQRARLLAAQLEREIQSALDHLGEDAMFAFLAAHRHGDRTDRAEQRRIVARVLERLRLRTWTQRRLDPLIRNHAARTLLDTERTLQAEIGIELQVAEQEVKRIVGGAGSHLNLPDIEPQARAAIGRAIEEGFARGENPVATARRIRQYVPAGRFVHAGSAYRSKLIARSETMNLQRAATLAAYDSNARITDIQIRDGLLSDSDADCIARNGTIVPKAQAAAVKPLHPQCTLSFSPVVAPLAVREPALAGVA